MHHREADAGETEVSQGSVCRRDGCTAEKKAGGG